ncbi:MAG TPA: hypothetical protein VHL53_22565 [Acidimicrobiia bacterium]|nr:hypothetical protein [Acidimicrobiia bacterium]
MTTRHYALPVETTRWFVEGTTETAFNWEYDEPRDRLLTLYEKGKRKQWDGQTLIDWSLDVDITDQGVFPDTYVPIFGSPTWERASRAEKDEIRHHYAAWLFSQFLHGEQGALLCSAKIVQTVPAIDSKFYAATQVMDEARHVAFGLLALQDAYRDLTAEERREREEFVIEAARLLRDRIVPREVYEKLGLPVEECLAYQETSDIMSIYRQALFARVVPIVKRIGLWSDKIQQAFIDLGVIAYADAEPAELFAHDEQMAEEIEAAIAARRNGDPVPASRAGDIAETISVGES